MAPIRIEKFGGLDDTNPSSTLDSSQAQSALNVESSLTGNALSKRQGYSRTATLTITTSPVSGSFFFVDANGNNQTIVCQDHNCAKSTNGAAFTVFLSTAGGTCTPTRWSWAAVNGTAFGANSCRDNIVIYNGSVLTSSSTIPKGAALELTRDRLVIVDVTANPNGAYYSRSGGYTDFVTGLNSADPYIDPIGAPGDRLIGAKYALGRLFLFKANSLTACNLKDQYSSTCYPVSNTIGTNDPLSIVEVPGFITFRGSDGNYWAVDESYTLSPISKQISNLVKSQTQGSVQSNTQSNQSDWQAGTQTPSGSWDTATLPGSIFASSSTLVDASTNSYGAGQFLVNLSTAISGQLFITQQASQTFVNAGSESNSSLNWAKLSGFDSVASATMFGARKWYGSTYDGNGAVRFRFAILDTSSNTIQSISVLPTGANKSYTINLSTFAYSMVKIRATFNYDGTIACSACLGDMISTQFIRPRSVTITVAGEIDSVLGNKAIWDVSEVDFTTSAYYTSQKFDLAYTTPTYGAFNVTLSSSVTNPVTFKTQVATSATTTTFDAAQAATPGNQPLSAQKRFFVYTATFTANSSTNTAATYSGLSLGLATTGLYQTQCIQAGNQVSSWGILSCAESNVGNASLVYYATSAATCAALPATPPTSWSSVTNNATLSIGVSSNVYIGFRSLLGASTDQAQVDSCSIYWNNGVTAPPAWGTYDSYKNAIYWTTSINNSATNNRVLKYDLNLNQWYPFDLTANAITRILNQIYFGDSTGGYWNLYGGVNSDNGAAINSYWKSKDFSGGVPFQDKYFNTISMVTKNQGAGTLNVTYTTSDNTSTTYSISLSTTTGATYVHANRLLSQMSPFQFLNVQFGNNSAIPWEIDGAEIQFNSAPWADQNP